MVRAPGMTLYELSAGASLDRRNMSPSLGGENEPDVMSLGEDSISDIYSAESEQKHLSASPGISSAMNTWRTSDPFKDSESVSTDDAVFFHPETPLGPSFNTCDLK